MDKDEKIVDIDARKVTRKLNGELDVVWCPSCGASFRPGTPHWGRDICGHCGQVLDWHEIINK